MVNMIQRPVTGITRQWPGLVKPDIKINIHTGRNEVIL